jgi:hypothetical protein
LLRGDFLLVLRLLAFLGIGLTAESKAESPVFFAVRLDQQREAPAVAQAAPGYVAAHSGWQLR